jgi:hypothetical protein
MMVYTTGQKTTHSTAQIILRPFSNEIFNLSNIYKQKNIIKVGNKLLLLGATLTNKSSNKHAELVP